MICLYLIKHCSASSDEGIQVFHRYVLFITAKVLK